MKKLSYFTMQRTWHPAKSKNPVSLGDMNIHLIDQLLIDISCMTCAWKWEGIKLEQIRQAYYLRFVAKA